MKNLMVNRVRTRNEKIKAQANQSKKIDGKQKNLIAREQKKTLVKTEHAIMKESKTLMID